MPEDQSPVPLRQAVDEPPPFLGTWPRVYIAVICYLAVLLTLLYWFSQAFSA